MSAVHLLEGWPHLVLVSQMPIAAHPLNSNAQSVHLSDGVLKQMLKSADWRGVCDRRVLQLRRWKLCGSFWMPV